jgi:hypothetical protein
MPSVDAVERDGEPGASASPGSSAIDTAAADAMPPFKTKRTSFSAAANAVAAGVHLSNLIRHKKITFGLEVDAGPTTEIVDYVNDEKNKSTSAMLDGFSRIPSYNTGDKTSTKVKDQLEFEGLRPEDFGTLPEGCELALTPGGKYFVLDHKNKTTMWHPSLPGEWEMCRTKDSGRLFFINHKDKSTTWKDPRTAEMKLKYPVHGSTSGLEPMQIIFESIKRRPADEQVAVYNMLGASLGLAPAISTTGLEVRLEKLEEAVGRIADKS